ncbi:MAG TPA: PAS domain S-box protein [Gemmatimonadaceae bacterium]|nr:PAS domain S-box protein [Gemmatimonadaceae bacterium]
MSTQDHESRARLARRRPEFGIRARLMLVVLAMVLPWLALTLLSLRDFRRERRLDAEGRVLEVARLLAARVDDQIGAVDALLVSLAQSLPVTPSAAAANDDLLSRIRVQLPPYFNLLGVWDSTGANVGSSEDSTRQARAVAAGELAFFNDAMSTGSLAVGEAVRGPMRGAWTLSIGRPIIRDERAVGVVSATARLEQLGELLLTADDLPGQWVITLLSRDGLVLARAPLSRDRIAESAVPPATARRLLGAGTGVELWKQFDGQSRIVGFHVLREQPWVLVVGAAESGPAAWDRRRLIDTLLLGALSLAVAIAFALMLSRQVARPLRQLTMDAERLRAGDPSVRTAISEGGEIGTLASAFNAMASALESRTAALGASEERYRLASRATRDVIYDWDIPSGQLIWSDDVVEAFRIARNTLDSSINWWEGQIHPDDRSRVLGSLRIALDSDDDEWEQEYRFRLGDGAYVEILDRGHVMRGANGVPLRMIGSMFDLTQLRRAERERDRFFALSVDCFCILTLDGRWKRVNPAFCALFDFAESEVLAMPALDLVHPDDRTRVRREWRLWVEEGRQHVWELRCRRRDGTERWIAWTVQIDEGERLVYAVGRDVTAQRSADAALRESEEWYRLLYDANPVPIWVYDLETLAFLSVNDAATRAYGWSREEFLRMSLLDIRPPADRERLLSVARAPVRPEFDHRVWRHQRRNGEVLLTEVVVHEITVDGRPARLSLAFDVSERHLIEERLRQSQKMEAVGRLAGGVAHDFNNLLTVISSYTRFLLGALPLEDPRHADAQQIQNAATRAADLTRQLLTLSKRQVLQPQLLDVNAVVREMQELLRRVISESIQLVTHLDESIGAVRCDRAQLEQVVMNLVVNACDAMPQGGVLSVSTRPVVLEPGPTSRVGGLPPGAYVMFAVRDTGVGMSAETLARVFEPFFTTKPKGKGTGLGLSTVYGIVLQSGGHVEVVSVEEQGTTVELYLPAVFEPADATTVAPVAAVHEGERGSETILLVEDEDAVRAIVRRVLAEQGYEILEAHDGEHALRIFERHRDRIDLVLTDVIMPGIGGRALAARLLQARPELPVVFMSGYTDDVEASGAYSAPGSAFVAKPFNTDHLLEIVRSMIVRSGSNGASARE